jgi:hypothetical protein
LKANALGYNCLNNRPRSIEVHILAIPVEAKENAMSTPLDTPEHAGAAAPEEPSAPRNSGTKLPHDQRDTLAALGAELLRHAQESQPALEAAWDELMAHWGVHGDPVGVQRLRALIQEECGSSGQDSDFSRELVARREEGRP